MNWSIASLLLALPFAASAAEHKVVQKDKAFSTVELVVKPGDSVRFENTDPFFHNIFSLSDAEMFDLGSFGTGESRSVTFKTEGTVEVECAIHPEMKMRVQVKK